LNTHLLRTDAYAESLSDTAVAANDETYDEPAAFAKELAFSILATSIGTAATTLDCATLGAVLSAAEAENDYYLGGYAGI
jgi:hypothetical protein